MTLIGRIRGGSGRNDWHKQLVVAAAALAAVVALLMLANADPLLLQRLRNIVFDSYQRLSPRPEAGAPVAIVDIDEASIARIGQWPWPRTTLADMVDRLGQMGAAAIAFDIAFPEADRTSPARALASLEAQGAKVELPAGLALDNDAVLAKAFAANPVIAGIAISNETDAALPAPKAGISFGGTDPKRYLPRFTGGVADLPELSAAASGLGFFSFPPAADGVVRSLPLLADARGQLYPALSVEALRIAQGAGSFVVRSTGASGEADTGQPAMTAFKVGALSMPTGPEGTLDIYYSGLPDLVTIPAADLLDPAKAPSFADAVNGHIVLVGTSAVGLRDLVATPLAQAVPGVRVHAEVIDQIMGQSFLSRPDWAPGAEVTMALVAALVVLLFELLAGAIGGSIATLLLLAIIAAGSWLAFIEERLLLDPVLPAAAALLAFAAATPVLLLWTDRERRFIRGAFGRYLSPELVGRLARNPDALSLGGEIRELTVLFSDIRNFTTLSEGLAPDALTSLLNDFLTPATDVLLGAEATLDKYIGDAIMAFWNAPLDIAGHPRKACLGALEMIAALNRLNARSGRSLSIGIGLNSGPCCVGNFGSSRRFNYSALGDAVNVASRVEGLTKQYHVPILVAEPTRRAAGDLAFLEADRVRVVGRSEPLPVHVLLGDAAYGQSGPFLALEAVHLRLLAAYRALDFEAAETALASTRALAPPSLAGLYDVYGERLATMRRDPPPVDWDGVFTAREK